jgi:hypothetical protein
MFRSALHAASEGTFSHHTNDAAVFTNNGHAAYPVEQQSARDFPHFRVGLHRYDRCRHDILGAHVQTPVLGCPSDSPPAEKRGKNRGVTAA